MRYQLRKENSKHFGTIVRPVVEVSLHGAEGVNEVFYVDSGADITIIPRSVGELLELELKEEDIIELYGIGESALSVVIKSVDMEIAGMRFTARVGWALTERVPLLLGRLDIFDHFRIIFNVNKGFVEFDSH